MGHDHVKPLYISRSTRQIVLEPSTAISTLFPNARAIAGGVVLPYDLPTYAVLRRIGYQLPNPIVHLYDWPGTGTPFKVQLATTSMLTANPRAYVLNEMGTGKTRAACWAWDYMRAEGIAGKLLVVAPLSTLSFVWGNELFATLPHRKYRILGNAKGVTKARRLEALNDPDAEVFVINHDGIKVMFKELMARKDIDTLIIDELAVFRNPTDRSKALRALGDRMRVVWGMTGSPMPNQPTDVWSQVKIVTPSRATKYFKDTRDMLMTRHSEHVWVPKDDAVEKAFQLMQPSVRFNLDDVVELPQTVSRVIDVPLSAKQERVYSALAKEYVAMVGAHTITAVNAAAAMSKLLQVATGWVYAGDFGALDLDATPRHDALMDIIQAARQKVIVFVPFRHAVEGLAKIMRGPLDKPPLVDFAMVHGDVGDRNDIFTLFQNTDKYRVILAHPRCMAHGLTLTKATTIVWYAPTTSLEDYEQANARIRRVGQKHKQQIIHLQSTPVERRIYSLLRSKQKVQDKLLEMFENATGGGALAA